MCLAQVRLGLGLRLGGLGLGLLFWLGGWLEIWRVKLVSTQVVVEVEVGVELGKNDVRVLKGILYNMGPLTLVDGFSREL